MGWLSKHRKDGGRMGPGMAGKNANKGPLRRVVGIIRHSQSIFESARVQLECGHEGQSWGGVRARCRKCWELSKNPDPKP